MGEPELKTWEQLNPRQQAFCLAYVANDFNATLAAKKSGYTKNAAAEAGYELLRNPHVRPHIDRLVQAKLESLGCTKEGVLQEITRLAKSDPVNYYKTTKKGETVLKNIKSLPKDHSAAIKKVRTKSRIIKEKYIDEQTGEEKEREIVYQDVEFELHDKKGPLELLAKHHGIITNDANLKVEITQKLEDFL